MNALCNLSRKKLRKVAAATSGPISEQAWFTLCITTKVKPRIVKEHKCHYCCVCKNYRGEMIEDEKNVFLHWFSASEDCEGVDKVLFFFFAS